MPSSPSLLVELIPSEAILQELDSSVKALPTVVRCPVNSDHKLTLHPDGATVWAACQDCGFSGDSVDIYKAKFNIQSVEGVMLRLENSGVVKAVPKGMIADYQMTRARRSSLDNCIAASKERLLKERYTLDILEHLGAAKPFKEDFETGIAKYIGALTQDDLTTFFRFSDKSPVRAIVFPYYDMPGRIATAKVIWNTTKGIASEERFFERPGGLFMLETAANDAEHVIAVDDPITACRIQMRRMMSVLSPLPIVAWHPETKYWPIAPKRVVFLAPKPTIEVFKQARLVPNAYICTPNSSIDLNKLLEMGEAKLWLHHVLSAAKPWIAAVKDHMLSMPEDQAAKFSRDLEITPLEVGEIIFECQSNEKSILSSIFDLQAAIKTVMVGDTRVVERDGAWWTATDKGRVYRIFNAPFSLDKSASYTGKGNYLIGDVTVDNKTERFMAPEKFLDNPYRWLRSFVLSKGMGLIHVAPGWDHRLIDIATAMNPIKMSHVTGKATVGWSHDLMRFSFPNVTLLNGRVDEEAMVLPGEHMPCTRVSGRPTHRSVWQRTTTNNGTNQAFWALLACVGANMCAKYAGYQHKRIGVIGQHRSMDALLNALDIVCVRAASRNMLIASGRKYGDHDVPFGIIFDGVIKQCVDWLEGSGTRNVLLSVNQAQASLIGGKDWVFVDIQNMGHALTSIQNVEGLMADVIRVVQTTGSAISSTKPELDILYRMLDFGAANKGDIQRDVFDGAAKLIKNEFIYGALPIHESFLYSLFALIRSDQVSVSRTGFSRRCGEVEMSTQHVRVSKSVLNKMLLPVGTSTLTEELAGFKILDKHTMNDWFINVDRWEELYSRWVSLDEPVLDPPNLP